MTPKLAEKPRLTVNPGDDPPAPEVMAQAIVDIADGMRKLNASRLKRETIVVLLQHSSKVSQRDIRAVLLALDKLEADYLKPKVK